MTSTTVAAPAALTPDQAQRVGRAREILGEKYGYDPADMAGRIGRLEWHLQELLHLISDLKAGR